jgi:DNA-directed RNA polymerase delta subunit
MARSRGVRSAGSTLQYAATKDTDDSESVLRLFEDLTISSVADGRIVSLSELDRQLRDWYEQEGISMKKFKDLLQTHAICLGDCQAYHSQEALKQALRADPSKIISRQKAKQYKFVKKCLIIL